MNNNHISLSLLIILTLFPSIVFANSAPVVSSVSAVQRDDDSKLVDIYYDLADAEGDNCTVWVFISNNDGQSWDIPAFTFTGDVGSEVAPGLNKHIVWDAGHDCPGKVGTFRARIFADDGRADDMVVVPAGNYRPDGGDDWVYVGTFFIDRYEVTNARYCEFLNAADPDGTHWDNDMEIGRSGSAGNYSYAVSAGKENYPVTWVYRDDTVAFANWRSDVTGLNYSVPTKYQWQKAAAWDPDEMRFYHYGWHNDSIDCNSVNYISCIGTTTPAGYYDGTEGREDAKSYYGCYDMSGNVSERVSGSYGENYYCYGGYFGTGNTNCRTTSFFSSKNYEYDRRLGSVGFRTIMEIE